MIFKGNFCRLDLYGIKGNLIRKCKKQNQISPKNSKVKNQRSMKENVKGHQSAVKEILAIPKQVK